jgi:glycerate kinase
MPLRVVIAPDKFKGSLAAPRVAEAMARGVRAAVPDAQLALIPMADGGEGTVEALVNATRGRTHALTVEGPRGAPVRAQYGVLGDKTTAVIEMASASGLVLLDPAERDPFVTSTYGTGQLLLAALAEGVGRVIVGIGGSATNDCGAGLGYALGYRFFDKQGDEVVPRGARSLGRIHRIDASETKTAWDRLRSVEAACDVKNPLTGPNGASYVFGPQKFDPSHPATPEQIAELDDLLAGFAVVIKKSLDVDITALPGAGAAGGLGGGLVAFAGAKLVPGVDLVIDAVRLRPRLAGAHLCLTGEGALDASTAHGKTVAGVSRLARELGIPTIALAGSIGEGAEALLEHGVDAYFSICNRPMTLAQATAGVDHLLASAAEQAVRAFVRGKTQDATA